MLKLAVLAVLSLAAISSAAPWNYQYWGWPYYHYGNPYYGGYWDPYYYPYHQSGGSGKLIFYGEFHGTCKGAPDGLYYVDERSFAFCSNGVKTIQPCAEGSANPSRDYFEHGQYYGFLDFCSINLVAKGYYRAPVVPLHPKVEETSYSKEEHPEAVYPEVPAAPSYDEPAEQPYHEERSYEKHEDRSYTEDSYGEYSR